MFRRLLEKEILSHLLDFRFVAVFSLCALLSVLSVFVGGQNYARRLKEHSAVSESSREAFQKGSVDKGRLNDVFKIGYRWNRPPEVLSPVVHGLSGFLGREALLRSRDDPIFEGSFFAADPVHALFGVLDLAFIVKVVMSLAVLLFTYDTICGEKEAGTLRLYLSFPIPRSTIALVKLAGSTVAVLVPLVFAFLLACAVLGLSPEIGLQSGDWVQMGALMVVFALYLTVFVAFGLLASALTHRRVVAFLCLLVLWSVWLFAVPNVAVRVSRDWIPAESFYRLKSQKLTIEAEIAEQRQLEIGEYWRTIQVEDWGALSEARRQELRDGASKIWRRWDELYRSRVQHLQASRREQLRRQQDLATVLSSLSPMGAVSLVSMDLARTGPVQQRRLEQSLDAYLINLKQFVFEKGRQHSGTWMRGVDLSGFTWFTYRDAERIGACLTRNAMHILNLVLLAVLGFAGAYVAILRYDVR